MMRGIGSEIVWSVAVNFLFKTLTGICSGSLKTLVESPSRLPHKSWISARTVRVRDNMSSGKLLL
jgi:hypothetical protein